MRLLSSKDILLGALYIGLGLVYGVYTLKDLTIGTAFNMGPGYFPLVLSGLLIVIGAVVVAKGVVARAGAQGFGPIPWRGLFAISLATIVFALLARGAGIFIATIATVMLASWGSTRATLLSSVMTSLILAAFCTLVFIYGMQLPLGIFGIWFR